LSDDSLSAGARHQFAALFSSQRGALVRWLARLIGDRHAAEDLAQDAYLKVAAVAETGAVQHPQSFLYQTARNLAFDHLRRQKVRAAVHPPASDMLAALVEAVPAQTPSPETRLLDRERVRRFQAALAELPERARQVLILQRVHGLTQVEIARRLGVTERTIAKDLALALRHCLAADIAGDG